MWKWSKVRAEGGGRCGGMGKVGKVEKQEKGVVRWNGWGIRKEKQGNKGKGMG